MTRTLAPPQLDPVLRANYEERVDRAVAELLGEWPEERRALLHDTIQMCSWREEPEPPDAERAALPQLTREEKLQRRFTLFLRIVRQVDPLLAERVDAVAVKRAILAHSTNKGGRGNEATSDAPSFEDAMRPVLLSAGLAQTELKAMKRRSQRRKPGGRNSP